MASADGESTARPVLDRPGVGTPAEATAWDSLRERVTISLRPIAAPSSLGFFGLAAATLLMSGLQLGWVGQEEGKKVALAGFAFLAQFVASIFCFLARDGAAATAMGILGSTWLVIGLVLLTSEPGATSNALGLFLVVVSSAMALTAVTAGPSKLVPALVFLVASARFLTSGVFELTGTMPGRTRAE
jgi:uncharacterized protein